VEIKRVGTQPSAKGPSEWFTGTVRIDPLFQAPEPHSFKAPAYRSSQARGLHGIRTRSVRLSS